MIEFALKRFEDNGYVTFGKLLIPRFNFSCLTIELTDGSELQFKQNCCINTGSYPLKSGFDQRCALYPIFKRKPVGFSKKPSFNLEVLDYRHLPTGDIGLGTARASDFALTSNYELKEKFPEICREVFRSREIVVLSVYRSKKFRKTSVELTETIGNFDFIEEDFDDDEPTELEHDAEP